MNSTSKDHCFISKALGNLGFGHKKESPYSLRISHSTLQFQKDWDALLGSQIELSKEFSSLEDLCTAENIRYRYAIAYEGEKPVLCAVFQIIRIRPENLLTPLKNDFLRCATHLMLNWHDISLLVCGNVFREDFCGYYADPSALTKEEGVKLVIALADEVVNEEGASGVMLKDLSSDVLLSEDFKFEKLEDDISMYLEIDPEWKDINGYLKVLSKKYAARAKKILASASELQVREMSLQDLEHAQEETHKLYLQVIHKQPYVFGTLSKGYFATQKKTWGHAFSVKGMYLNDKLVAFYSTFAHPTELEVHYVGIDYTFNQSHSLYFNIHFLALQDAMQWQKDTLNMGRTSLEAKAILGCKPKYNETYLRFNSSLAEFAYGYFKKNGKESDSWKERHPLKVVEASKVEVLHSA